MVKTFHQVNAEKNQQPAPDSSQADHRVDGFAPRTFHQKQQQKDLSAMSQPAAPPTNAPKALFQPTVQAVADEHSLALVQTAITQLALDDYQFQDSEIQRACLLKATIRVDDPAYVTDYGAEASQLSESILNQLNTVTRTDYADGVKKYLALILQDTQKVDVDAIRAATNPSFFDRLFSKAVSNKAAFTELERNIRNNSALCQDRLNQLKKTQQIFTELFQKNEQQFKSLTLYLLAGQVRLEEEQVKLQQTDQQARDVFAQQAQLDKKDALARFERRLHTLKVLRHTVLLRIGQLRLEQKNTLTLIDQANETINLVIPAWRQQILALFSLSASDTDSELYQQLAATQESLNKKLLSLGN